MMAEASCLGLVGTTRLLFCSYNTVDGETCATKIIPHSLGRVLITKRFA